MLLRVSNLYWAQLGSTSSACLIRAPSWAWGQLVVSLWEPCLGWLGCLDLSLYSLLFSRRLAWAYSHGDLKVPKCRKIGQTIMSKCFPSIYLHLIYQHSIGRNKEEGQTDLRSGDTDSISWQEKLQSHNTKGMHTGINWRNIWPFLQPTKINLNIQRKSAILLKKFENSDQSISESLSELIVSKFDYSCLDLTTCPFSPASLSAFPRICHSLGTQNIKAN